MHIIIQSLSGSFKGLKTTWLGFKRNHNFSCIIYSSLFYAEKVKMIRILLTLGHRRDLNSSLLRKNLFWTNPPQIPPSVHSVQTYTLLS